VNYVFILLSGIADQPHPDLEGRTPLQAATTPNLDDMTRKGQVSTVQFCPPPLTPEPDLALRSAFGYQPILSGAGWGPLDAAGLRVDLDRMDLAFRIQLIDSDGEVVLNPDVGRLPAGDAYELIQLVARKLSGPRLQLFPAQGEGGMMGTRHVLVLREARGEAVATSPYDAVDQPLAEEMPRGEGEARLRQWMFDSFELLSEHRINRRRRDEGKAVAAMLWPWSPGRSNELTPFTVAHGATGTVVAGSVAARGMARLAGLRTIDVPGATGDLDTDYAAKARAALFALRSHPFVIIHVEAPLLASRMGDIEAKVDAIERVDERLLGTLLESIGKLDDFRILVTTDLATPCSERRPVEGPVPYLITGSLEKPASPRLPFDERAVEEVRRPLEEGWHLVDQFLAG
jgi:2,3-bisphosphoglycerate-independent phosphoglycerate mutase